MPPNAPICSNHPQFVHLRWCSGSLLLQHSNGARRLLACDGNGKQPKTMLCPQGGSHTCTPQAKQHVYFPCEDIVYVISKHCISRVYKGL